MMSTLFARLSLVFTAILLSLGLMTLTIANRSQQRYFDEFTQELNRPVAMYMANQTSLFVDGSPDEQALTELAEHVMMINPSLELYLLDTEGVVIDSAIDESEIVLSKIDLEPVQRFLSDNTHLPVYGDNPVSPEERRVFSVFPVSGLQAGNSGCEQCGYVYAILGGERHRSLWQSLATSYALRDTTAMFAGVLFFAMGSGIAIFFLMTKPLRAMSSAIGQWRLAAGQPVDSLQSEPANVARQSGSELQTLEKTCLSMAQRLNQQYQALDVSDKQRRQFLTSISHDLRTPLTSLSGAIETLLLKQNELTDAEVHEYLLLAQRQGGRLWRLIAQIFELARLDSGVVTVQLENFPLSELVYDTVQDLEPVADEQQVQLRVQVLGGDKSAGVVADMGLMQRVVENLMTNAIRHTPQGGQVTIRLDKPGTGDHVRIEVQDSGSGFSSPLSACPLAHINDGINPVAAAVNVGAKKIECQRLENGATVAMHGSGLGLGIVHRILALHDSEALVWSVPGEGTLMRFEIRSSQAERPDVDTPGSVSLMAALHCL